MKTVFYLWSFYFLNIHEEDYFASITLMNTFNVKSGSILNIKNQRPVTWHKNCEIKNVTNERQFKLCMKEATVLATQIGLSSIIITFQRYFSRAECTAV